MASPESAPARAASLLGHVALRSRPFRPSYSASSTPPALRRSTRLTQYGARARFPRRHVGRLADTPPGTAKRVSDARRIRDEREQLHPSAAAPEVLRHLLPVSPRSVTSVPLEHLQRGREVRRNRRRCAEPTRPQPARQVEHHGQKVRHADGFGAEHCREGLVQAEHLGIRYQPQPRGEPFRIARPVRSGPRLDHHDAIGPA